MDDLIVYLTDFGYRLVVNCGTRAKDLAWMAKIGEGFAVEIHERPELAMIAVQGPNARALVAQVLNNPALLDFRHFVGQPQAARTPTGMSPAPVTPAKMVLKLCCQASKP